MTVKIGRWHTSRRHALLVLFGVVYCLVGYGLIFGEHTATLNTNLRFLLAVAPYPVLGACWMVAGALAILSARWPPGRDAYGWAAMTFLAWLWTLVYLVATLTGGDRALSGLALYGAMSGVMVVASGWREVCPHCGRSMTEGRWRK